MLVLMNIEGALADLGCGAVSAAATVDRALALMEAQRFDLAMLDVNLGGETSYLVADTLALRSIPFAFSTGYSQHRIEARFGDRPVLRKPYTEEQMGAVLLSLMPVDYGVAA